MLHCYELQELLLLMLSLLPEHNVNYYVY